MIAFIVDVANPFDHFIDIYKPSAEVGKIHAFCVWLYIQWVSIQVIVLIIGSLVHTQFIAGLLQSVRVETLTR